MAVRAGYDFLPALDQPLLVQAPRAWKHAQRTSNRTGRKGGRLGTFALQVGALPRDVHVDLRLHMAPAEASRELRQIPIRSPPPNHRLAQDWPFESWCSAAGLRFTRCCSVRMYRNPPDISLERNRRPVAFPILPGSQFASFSRFS